MLRTRSAGATPLLTLPARADEGQKVAVDGFAFTVPPGWRKVDPGRAQGSVTHVGLWLQGRYADQAFIALDLR